MTRRNPFTALPGVLLGFVMTVMTASAAADEDDTAETPDAEKALELYEENCAACHGYDGQPMVPGTPNFATGERLEKGDEELLASIREGINDMPPWDEDLSDAEQKIVVNYLRTLATTGENGQ